MKAGEYRKLAGSFTGSLSVFLRKKGKDNFSMLGRGKHGIITYNKRTESALEKGGSIFISAVPAAQKKDSPF